MSFHGTRCQCSCCGYHSPIVAHCYWFVRNCGANGWWPAGCEWRRHCGRESSSEREWPSYRGTPMKLIFYWEKCCRRCNVKPNAADVARDSVSGERYASGSGERPVDGGVAMVPANLRRPPSARRPRPRPRLVNGGDWF